MTQVNLEPNEFVIRFKEDTHEILLDIYNQDATL